MKREIFGYEPSDFSLIDGWWQAKKLPSPDPDLLPPHGFIVTANSVPVCAGFVFRTDAKIAILNHVISSPTHMDKEQRDACLGLLIYHVILFTKNQGFRVLSAACNMPRMGKRYEQYGFAKTDSNETHYGRIL